MSPDDAVYVDALMILVWRGNLQRGVKCREEQEVYHLGRNHQTRPHCVVMCPVTVPSMHGERTNNLDKCDVLFVMKL
jgi:hypothetical protein